MGNQGDGPKFVPLEWWDTKGLSAEQRTRRREHAQQVWAKRIRDWGLADDYGIPPARHIPGYGMTIVLERHDGKPVTQLIDGMGLWEHLALARGGSLEEVLGDRLPRQYIRALHQRGIRTGRHLRVVKPRS